MGIAHFQPLGHITVESFDQLFSTNVRATVFLVQKALPLMTSGGVILLIRSVNRAEGTSAKSVFGGTKAAICNLARSCALDLEDKGIRVQVLSSGATYTENLVKNLSGMQ